MIFKMKIFTGTALLAAGIFLGAGTIDAHAKAAYRTIAPAEAKKKLDADKRIILLDVRTAEEYAEKHIAGSMLIPLDTLQNEAVIKIPDKKTQIFVYCRSGRRSKAAAEMLLDMGYTNVFDLGGINTWPYGSVSGK